MLLQKLAHLRPVYFRLTVSIAAMSRSGAEVPFPKAFPFFSSTLNFASRLIDFPGLAFNNPRMARPDAVRRIKSYSAANGYVYQYCFYEVNRIIHDGAPAGEFIYAISADRKTTFGLRIVVEQSALEAWAQANGRALTISEEYAVAKMRLFQAFDEGAVPVTAEAAADLRLHVDASNLEQLLQSLDI